MTGNFPLMPPRSTESRLAHFDDLIYSGEPDTILYKFIDALCGDSGAGSLKKEIFIQRLSGSLQGIYGSDLDFIFGNVRFLSRTTSESYPYDPMTQMLTSWQWDEVRVKDEQFRNRIREFFVAAAKGNTTDGVRQLVHAATSADCEILESWRWLDNFGWSGSELGRAKITTYAAVNLVTGHKVFFHDEEDPANAKMAADDYLNTRAVPTNWLVEKVQSRSEFTVVPHKQDLSPSETCSLRNMLARIAPLDNVVTISPQGLNINSPIAVQAAAADSTYFQVEKWVTPTPLIADISAPELLAVDLVDPTERWLFSNSVELAPYSQFNISAEYSYCYLVSGGNRSPIDSVTYGTLNEDGVTVTEERPFEWFEQVERFTEWTLYEQADSPDNYPGGKFGLTPASAPALTANRTPYQFPYSSQDEYVGIKQAEVHALGGQYDARQFRLPIEKPGTYKRSYTADLAIAATAPARESSITSGWTSRKVRSTTNELRNPSIFVRS